MLSRHLLNGLAKLFLLATAAFSLACDGNEPESTNATFDAPDLAPTLLAQASTTVTPPTVSPSPTPDPTPIVVANLPIVDLHFHPDQAWGATLVELLDRIGVRMAGNGASGPTSVALAEAERHRGRVVAFAGGHEIRQLVSRHGQAAWNTPNPEVERFLAELEEGLRREQFGGIGELHVNNHMSNLPNAPQYRYPADSRLLQRLWDLSVVYGVPLSVHMDAESESVEQMERLLASDRRGTWLWAHTGHYAEPALLRQLLSDHPNLFCELSYRLSISGSRTAIPIDQAGRLREAWRVLLEEFPDRFVIGTDIGFASASLYAQHIGFWRLLLEQVSPETAARIAHANAERLLSD